MILALVNLVNRVPTEIADPKWKHHLETLRRLVAGAGGRMDTFPPMALCERVLQELHKYFLQTFDLQKHGLLPNASGQALVNFPLVPRS